MYRLAASDRALIMICIVNGMPVVRTSQSCFCRVLIAKMKEPDAHRDNRKHNPKWCTCITMMKVKNEINKGF